MSDTCERVSSILLDHSTDADDMNISEKSLGNRATEIGGDNTARELSDYPDSLPNLTDSSGSSEDLTVWRDGEVVTEGKPNRVPERGLDRLRRSSKWFQLVDENGRDAGWEVAEFEPRDGSTASSMDEEADVFYLQDGEDGHMGELYIDDEVRVNSQGGGGDLDVWCDESYTEVHEGGGGE